VIERRERFGLALESGQTIGIRSEIRWQGLDRHLPVKLGIRREIHHTHAATPEFAQDLKWADGGGVHW